MKWLFVLAVALFGPTESNAQTFTPKLIIVKQMTFLHRTPQSGKIEQTLNAGEIVALASYVKPENDVVGYWHVYRDMPYYMPDFSWTIDINDSLRRYFASLPIAEDSIRIMKAADLYHKYKETAINDSLAHDEAIKKRIEGYKKLGLAVSYDWIYPNKYSSFPDISFKVINFSKKAH